MIYHIDSSDDAEPWPLVIEGTKKIAVVVQRVESAS
jgi:hypothetical protein